MTLSLFQDTAFKAENFRPLADRIRPNEFDEIIGHEAIIGKNSVLMRSIAEKRLFSFIFWGPPGVGKTTIARLLAKKVDAHFISVSAVTSGVKELREAIQAAERNRDRYNSGTILFIDEIHRYNKSQQDALLHAVESGLITLLGATTENPSFEVNSALLSRLKVFKLDLLTEADLGRVVDRAIHVDEEYKNRQIEFEDREYLIYLSGGDGRKCLSILETAISLAGSSEAQIFIQKSHLKEAALALKSAYDKKADYHYDTISAFIKSIRGSDPDAALVWLARMIDGGEDPIFIIRRLIVLASEDIGNADPTALILATSALTALQNIGMPEGRIILSQVVTYLASTFKSNASYQAIDAALKTVKESPVLSVPLHLRNAPTKLMKENDYGKDYKYPHAFDNQFVEENYFPPELTKQGFYQPKESGREAKLRERLKKLWGRF